MIPIGIPAKTAQKNAFAKLRPQPSRPRNFWVKVTAIKVIPNESTTEMGNANSNVNVSTPQKKSSTTMSNNPLNGCNRKLLPSGDSSTW